ncbi:MAG TPA: hypothetical protein VH257_21590, partial [Chloroflexota bacterium]|nr:hypothetical protein [Chloroflexota bacterium]
MSARPSLFVRDPARAAETLDPWRLAGLLIPGLGPGERTKLARAFGLTLPPAQPRTAQAKAREQGQILGACRERLASLDLSLLQRLARLFAGSPLPEGQVVDEVFRARVREVFSADAPPSSLGQDGE